MKIRNKILLVFLPIVLLSVATMTQFSRRVVQQVLIQEVIRSGRSLSLNLTQSPEMVLSFQTGNEKLLLPPLQQIQENAGTLYAMVMDPEGRVLAHTNVVEKGRHYTDVATVQALKSDHLESRQGERDGQPVMDIAFPVWELEQTEGGEEFLLLGRKEVRAKRRLGTVRLGLPLQGALETADRISTQVFWIIALVNLLAMGLTLFYVGRILRPVRFLAEAAERIGQGEVGETVPVFSRDEMGGLARSFNRMSRDLAATTVSKDFLDSILRNMQDVLVVTDPEGRIRLLNERALKLLEYGEEELMGRPAALLFPDEEELFKPAGLEKLRRQHGISSLEMNLVTRADEQVPVLLSAAPFMGRDGQVEGLIVTATDIIERKQAKEQIRSSLQEKEVLLKEIHHRVKNNLQVVSSLLNLQSGQIEDEKTLEMFSDSQNRVKSMALIHEQLYQSDDLAWIDFAEYLRNLVDNLFQSYRLSAQNVRLEVNVENILMGIDQAIPCGLVVNELVSNALKYAFPDRRGGKVSLHLSQGVDGKLILIVGDDGVGLPEGMDFRQTESLGLKLVNILVRQLDGTIELDGSVGTKFKIEFGGVKKPAPGG